VQVAGLSNIVAIGAAGTSSYALAADGAVYAWGSDGSGQLCNGGSNSSSTSPTVISAPAVSPTSLSTGVNASHVVMAQADGAAVSCGNNWSGQLGLGTMNAGSGSPATVVPNW
jgi:alpha-tubulin suppressor-like RCC1 family protein